jgi:hypothetical protein
VQAIDLVFIAADLTRGVIAVTGQQLDRLSNHGLCESPHGRQVAPEIGKFFVEVTLHRLSACHYQGGINRTAR